MSEKEKAMLPALVEKFDLLPTAKQQYFNGYADGVADIKNQSGEENEKEAEK